MSWHAKGVVDMEKLRGRGREGGIMSGWFAFLSQHNLPML